jgi:AraC-like DNA-binding protein
MQQLTLGKISEEVNLTREHFCRLFKAETGFTPAKYIKHLKLQRGKHLLENTFLSIKEITHKVGLNDESHFVKDFKSVFGVTPAKYRSMQFRSKQLDLYGEIESENQ